MNTSNNLTINHRAPWTDKETKQLIKEVKNNLNIEEIANIHKRTINAIKYKLIRYAIDMADTDQTLSLTDISKKTGLSINELKEGFDKLHYDYHYMEDNESNEDTDSNFTDDTFIDNNTQTDIDNNNDIQEIKNDINNINKKNSILIYLCCLWILVVTLDSINKLVLNWYDIALNIYSTFKSNICINNTDINDMSLMLLSNK